jgi:glyoxylase-like metal-dependent hydrolase (beta-lactamase superfamily II)
MKALFVQDVHGPIHPGLKSNAEDYQRSLKLMLDLDADILCEGHYGIFRGRERVDEFIKRLVVRR